MARLAYSDDVDRGEAQFFFTMSCLLVAIIVAGFSFNIVTGRSTFASPLLLHVHGVVMMGGLALYLAQNTLIFADRLALHRRLGWVAVIWVPLMVLSGLLLTRYSLQVRGGPPFFDQNQFLISNSLHLVCFGALVGWAIAARKNTGWHRRLMFCGFAVLLGPGVGRLIPAPLLIPYSWYFAAVLPPILFMTVGILADHRRYGRAHPAWFWGIGVVLVVQAAADLFAYSSAGLAFTDWFIEGTPGAERPLEAFVPPA